MVLVSSVIQLFELRNIQDKNAEGQMVIGNGC